MCNNLGIMRLAIFLVAMMSLVPFTGCLDGLTDEQLQEIFSILPLALFALKSMLLIQYKDLFQDYLLHY